VHIPGKMALVRKFPHVGQVFASVTATQHKPLPAQPALLSRQQAERIALRLITVMRGADLNVREVVEHAGIGSSVDELLRGGLRGLDPERLHQLNSQAMGLLADVANRQDGRPPIRVDDWAMLHYCLISSRTLREVIARAGRFYRMLDERWGRLELHVQASQAEIRTDSLRVRRNAVAFVVDAMGLAVIHHLFSWLIGQTIPVSVILMNYDEALRPCFDNDTLPFPLQLQAGRTALCFPAEFLDYPVVRAPEDTPGPGLLFDLQEDRGDAGLAERARQLMVQALREQRRLPSLDKLAGQLECSVASLRRHLSRAGASYNVLKDSCRRELALDLLRRTSLSVEDIATRLDFCDSDAFRRAFRDWMDQSPLQYRKGGVEAGP